MRTRSRAKTIRRAAPVDKSKLRAKSPLERSRAARLFNALKARHPNAKCALHWSRPHELLIATILSAQSTDIGVNKATPALFAAFPTPCDFARATIDRIEPFVRTLNFWRNKAKAVHESMRVVCDQFHGEVPRSMDALLTLRGVARKTANVVLGNAFHLNEGVVVDTHVGRLSQRMGLSKHEDPVAIERDLMMLIPRQDWCMLSNLLIAHGRQVCKARGGSCQSDPICQEFCSQAKAAHSTKQKLSSTSKKAISTERARKTGKTSKRASIQSR